MYETLVTAGEGGPQNNARQYRQKLNDHSDDACSN